MNSGTMKSEQHAYDKHLRDTMQKMLDRCTDSQRDLFRRMYNHEGKHGRDVDGVLDRQLDNAFGQIERTLKNNEARALEAK